MKTLMRKVALILVLVCIFAMVLPVSAAEERIDLYKSGGGDGPKNVLAVGDIAVKFTVPEGKMLKAFVFIDSPTWTKKDSTGEIVLFRWNTDYATTVAGDRLESHSELHADNSDFRLDVKGYYGPGTYLVLMPKDAATNDLGVWTDGKNPDVGAVTYINGKEVSYMAKSCIYVADDNPPTSDSTTVFAYVLIIAAAGAIVFKKRRAEA